MTAVLRTVPSGNSTPSASPVMSWSRLGSAPGGTTVPATLDSVSASTD
eukprot:CAMPEP_0183801114 /NCGR_PEP_ID=MMETSP0803_2-20130417/26841_1 /TAXON_ID=195967 /ORGANISM="Crustomastix stigmata, Strain CCMP3273" /LENGTH=47 /DNA_ID= /DNA_START= /DNA_END= /DNA_ORIENTATION=